MKSGSGAAGAALDKTSAGATTTGRAGATAKALASTIPSFPSVMKYGQVSSVGESGHLPCCPGASRWQDDLAFGLGVRKGQFRSGMPEASARIAKATQEAIEPRINT